MIIYRPNLMHTRYSLNNVIYLALSSTPSTRWTCEDFRTLELEKFLSTYGTSKDNQSAGHPAKGNLEGVLENNVNIIPHLPFTVLFIVSSAHCQLLTLKYLVHLCKSLNLRNTLLPSHGEFTVEITLSTANTTQKWRHCSANKTLWLQPVVLVIRD